MSSAPGKLTANIKAQGCAAKLSPVELSQILHSMPSFESSALLCGSKNFEDAAVYKINDEMAIVSTIDFFPPVIDDPYLYGRIAAVNALSDIYAMGGKPLFALNVFCFPTCDYPLSIAEAIIAGGASAVKDADCLLVGGHSIQASEPIYGLAVTGMISPNRILSNDAAKSGDSLILCKALGTGVALLSYKGEQLSEAAFHTLSSSLSRLNKECLEIAFNYDLHAATDITGFGFVGHIHEMSKASGLKAVIQSSKLPLLPEVLACAEMGLVPAAAYANRKSYSSICTIADSVSLALSDIMFDPQTSGGLLFAIGEDEADSLCAALKSGGWTAEVVGKLVEGIAGTVEIL